MIPRQSRLIGAGLVVVLLGGAAIVSSRLVSQSTGRHAEKATYYCPMHPSYTSDRPGDCPICNMKLVKKETDPEPRALSPERQGAEAKDICYLHNCPMVHEGKPCPMLVVAKEGEKVTCPICGSHVAEAATTRKTKKILYWTDPMIPGYKSEKPGTSPMGMELMPVHEEAGVNAVGETAPEGYASILVTPQKRQLIGVTTAPVTRQPLAQTIRTVGTIAHDPALYQAQAEYLHAVKALERARREAADDVVEQAEQVVEAARLHLRHQGLSEELITELATREEPDHSLLIGHPGQPVWVYAKIYDYELPQVRVGQAVKVEVPALPGQAFEGVIRAIDPMVDEMTRTTRIRAQVHDPDGHLKPEMYVNVELAVDLGEVLAIPEEAVFHTGTKQIVFVDKGKGLFEPRDVVVGAKADQFYEVKSGVAEGETVVTSGNFLIDSESRLKAALQGMTGGEHQHGQSHSP